MIDSNILNLFKIPNVSDDINYWILRTNGGIYYDDFVLHEYISIAWDYATLNILNKYDDDSIKRIIEFNEKSSPINKTEDEDEEDIGKGLVTTILNKLTRFVFEIDKGDIVLIPSKNSDNITIAEVVGDVYETTNYVETYLEKNPNTEITPCPYHKRRRIHSLKTISKNKLDIYLSKGFNSQHALSNMNDYSPFINRTIYDIYTRKNELHSTLHAGHPNGLTLKELTRLSTYLDTTVDNIAAQCNVEFKESDIEIKLNIHSPGLIEIITYGASAGITISLVIFALNNLVNGGKFHISVKKNKDGELDFAVGSESKGVSGNAREDKKIELKEREQALQIIKELDIKSPDIISSFLNGDKITPEMVVNAIPKDDLSIKTE